MREFTCARCGRTEGFDEFDGPPWPTLEASAVQFGWGRFATDVVCPGCQSDDEKRELKKRLVFLVEQAVRSHLRDDTDPSPMEAAIIGLAMALREEPNSEVVPVDAEESAPKEQTGVEQRRLTVAITGAFLTGCPLRIANATYRAFQDDLVRELRQEFPDDGWTTGARGPGAGTYASGGGFVDEVPLVLARRGGSGTLAKAMEGRKIAEFRQLSRVTGGWRITPHSMHIEIYDLGVGVIDARFDVDVPRAVPLSDAASTLKRAVLLRPDPPDAGLTAVAMALRELSIETTDHLAKVIANRPPGVRLTPWLTDEGTEQTDRWGRLLWLHPVHLLAAPSPRTRRSDAREVAPVFSASIDIPGGCFAPGIGWSAVATGDGTSGIDLPMRLLSLQWAFIALYMEIDRGLLTILDNLEARVSADGRRRTLTDLEKEAARVFRWHTRVVGARARVDTTLAGLGGDEQAVWDKMVEVTKYDTLVDGVDRKLEALRHITERRVQEAAAAQARRSTVSLGLLTTLGLVTLSIAAVGYFFGSLKEDGATPAARIAVFTAGIMIALVLWWFVFWKRAKEHPYE